MEVKIPDKAWDFFSDVSNWAKTLVFVSAFAFAGFVIYALYIKKEDPVPDLSTEQKTKKAKQNVEISIEEKRIFDDLQRKDKMNNGTYRDEINKQCANIQRDLKDCVRVDYWKVDNDGEPIYNDQSAYFLTIISSSNDFQFDFRNKKEIPRGYFWFANEILSKQIHVEGDVENNGSIVYDPETRDFLRFYETKSLVGAVVKSDRYEWYFVTYSFKDLIVEGSAREVFLKQHIRDFRRFVQKRQ